MASAPKLDDLGAFVALLRSQALPADQLAGFALELGSATELLQLLRSGALPGPKGELSLGLFDDQLLATSQADVERWRVEGYDVRTVFDASYPTNLLDVSNKPPFVFLKGSWDDRRDSRTVAVVGTRLATDAGVRRAKKLATALARSGITVVSGLARGIDTAAHESALAAGGRTSAVLGTGIDFVYPAENRPLAERILAGSGALISQFLPQQPPTKWTFPKRNVVMSGLSWVTVVIEASYTSGARVQATEALRHGRTVYLLQSLVDSHKWAREYVTEGKFGVQAKVLTDVEQLIEALSLDFVSV
jgi:DNA processing protein